MVRKLVVALALLVGLFGSSSAAWAGTGPMRSGAGGATLEHQLAEIGEASVERSIAGCGYGYMGYIHIDASGQIHWGQINATSDPGCQGPLRILAIW